MLSRSECYSPCHYTTHRSGTQPAACMHAWTIQPASLPACLPHLRARRRRQPQREPSSGYGTQGPQGALQCRSVGVSSSVGAVSGQCQGSVRAVSVDTGVGVSSSVGAVSEQCRPGSLFNPPPSKRCGGLWRPLCPVSVRAEPPVLSAPHTLPRTHLLALGRRCLSRGQS